MVPYRLLPLPRRSITRESLSRRLPYILQRPRSTLSRLRKVLPGSVRTSRFHLQVSKTRTSSWFPVILPRYVRSCSVPRGHQLPRAYRVRNELPRWQSTFPRGRPLRQGQFPLPIPKPRGCRIIKRPDTLVSAQVVFLLSCYCFLFTFFKQLYFFHKYVY